MPDLDVSDVQSALTWLVPPKPPADDAEGAGEINEKIKRRQALDDRLSGLFEDEDWISLTKADELWGYLSEWIISDSGIKDFKSKLSDENTFLTWLEEEVGRWENGEKVAQQNPDADPAKPWTAWYKYDTDSQEYYYAEDGHSDDWRTWDEWEPPEPAEPETYPVHTHQETQLQLQYSDNYWLYEGEWLTGEELTTRVLGAKASQAQTFTGVPSTAKWNANRTPGTYYCLARGDQRLFSDQPSGELSTWATWQNREEAANKAAKPWGSVGWYTPTNRHLLSEDRYGDDYVYRIGADGPWLTLADADALIATPPLSSDAGPLVEDETSPDSEQDASTTLEREYDAIVSAAAADAINEIRELGVTEDDLSDEDIEALVEAQILADLE